MSLAAAYKSPLKGEWSGSCDPINNLVIYTSGTASWAENIPFWGTVLHRSPKSDESVASPTLGVMARATRTSHRIGMCGYTAVPGRPTYLLLL